MGSLYTAKCKKCNHEFGVRDGGGFIFDLIRCEKCGNTRDIPHGEGYESGPYICKCGGKMSSEVRPMCPKCGASDYDITEYGMEYD